MTGKGQRRAGRGRPWWLACLLIVASHAHAVTVYKWVDEHGRVHFSDQPQGNFIETLQVRSGARYGNEAPQKKATESGPEPAAAGQTGPAKAQTPSPAEARRAAKEKRKLRRRNCRIARENLARDERISRMYRVGADGERIWLTEAERDAVIEKGRREVKKWCGK